MQRTESPLREGALTLTEHLHLQAQMLSINDLKINIFLTTQKLTKKHSGFVRCIKIDPDHTMKG